MGKKINTGVLKKETIVIEFMDGYFVNEMETNNSINEKNQINSSEVKEVDDNEILKQLIL
jgi:hypothetical protein